MNDDSCLKDAIEKLMEIIEGEYMDETMGHLSPKEEIPSEEEVPEGSDKKVEVSVVKLGSPSDNAVSKDKDLMEELERMLMEKKLEEE